MKKALLILFASTTAHANPADIFGYGARGAAMGGAQVATANDVSATYYNPALLAATDDIHIDIGYQLGAPALTVDGRDLHVDGSRGLSTGIVVPGSVAGRRVAIGAGLFLPDQQITRTRSLPSQKPRFQLYDNRPQRLMLSADAAIELRRGLWLGGGLAYMSSTHGTVTLQGLVGFPQPELSNLALSIDVDLKTIRYPHAGIAWQARPWLALGASYRGGFKLTLDQGVRIQGDVGLPDSPPVVADGFLALTTKSQDLFQPAQVTVGFAAQLTARTMLAYDVAWHRWSTFENPAAHITIDYFLGQFNNLVHIPPARPLPAPHFHDIIVSRLGVEHTRGAWTFRGGYVYEPSPAPEQVGETNFIDNDKHTLSLGAGYQLPHLTSVILKPLSLDAFVSFTYLVPRDHEKISPIDAVGDYHSAGHVIAGGISSRWRF